MPTLVCRNCSTSFQPVHRYLRSVQKFCSAKCRETQLKSKCLICSSEFNWDRHGKKLRKYCSIRCKNLGRQNRVFFNCKGCGTKFFVQESVIKRRKVEFCTRTCRITNLPKKTRSQVLLDYNHKPEIVIKKREYYFGGFYQEKIRQQAVERDQTCQVCNSQKDLVVHHRDGNRLNNNLVNLITLCRGCHPTIHRKGVLLYV